MKFILAGFKDYTMPVFRDFFHSEAKGCSHAEFLGTDNTKLPSPLIVLLEVHEELIEKFQRLPLYGGKSQQVRDRYGNFNMLPNCR